MSPCWKQRCTLYKITPCLLWTCMHCWQNNCICSKEACPCIELSLLRSPHAVRLQCLVSRFALSLLQERFEIDCPYIANPVKMHVTNFTQTCFQPNPGKPARHVMGFVLQQTCASTSSIAAGYAMLTGNKWWITKLALAWNSCPCLPMTRPKGACGPVQQSKVQHSLQRLHSYKGYTGTRVTQVQELHSHTVTKVTQVQRGRFGTGRKLTAHSRVSPKNNTHDKAALRVRAANLHAEGAVDSARLPCVIASTCERQSVNDSARLDTHRRTKGDMV